jgi:predicted dehydrogenase
VAVVGLGKMGVMHTTMARTCPEVELVGLVDRDGALARHVQSMMGSPVPVFDSLGALCTGAAPEAVVLATPQFTHADLIAEATHAGLHVLCEKPLAHTLASARTAAEAATKAAQATPARVVQVGFMKGHDPLFRRAALLLRAHALDAPGFRGEGAEGLQAGAGYGHDAPGTAGDPRGVLGELRGFQASVHLGQVFRKPKGWTFTKHLSGGGVLINTGIHLLFLLRLWFGPLRQVACRMASTHAETEDTVAALVEHAPGTPGDTGKAPEATVCGSVHVSWSTAGCDTEATSLVVQGTNGTLWVEDDLIRVYLVEAQGGLPRGWTVIERRALESPGSTFNLSPEYAGEAYFREMQNFARTALGDVRGFGYDADFALSMQAELDAWYRSAQSAGAWTSPEPVN